MLADKPHKAAGSHLFPEEIDVCSISISRHDNLPKLIGSFALKGLTGPRAKILSSLVVRRSFGLSGGNMDWFNRISIISGRNQ